jgi:GH24 family phage-related lysozyme (muramidase)
MQIDERGLQLIEGFEGWSSTAYWDQWGHVWTIGFGETQGVHQGMVITRAQGEELLRQHVDSEYGAAVNALHADLNQNQFDALTSLAYNVGPGVLGWGIGAACQNKNWALAASYFDHYVFAGGVRLQGLANRRAAEKSLFLTPVKPPNPYAIYPDHAVTHGLNERHVVARTDGALKNKVKYHNYLKGVLYSQLKALRDHAALIALYQPPTYRRKRRHPVWSDSRDLGKRWQGLNRRMKEISAIK